MSPTQRYLRPSTLVLGLLTSVFIFLLALTKISNYDIWHHLATGRYILEAGFAKTDPFTYTQPDASMYLLSWLAGAFFYSIWRVGGLGGLTLAKALLAVALFGLLWTAARQKAPRHRAFGLVAAAVLVMGGFGLKFRLFIRPHLLELLLLAGALHLLERCRWRVLPLVPALAVLQLLWVNVHGSFPIGFALPVLFLAADSLDALTGRPVNLRQAVRVAGLTLLALLVATALNPVGPNILAAPFTQMGMGEYMRTVGEWQPMRLAHLTGFGLRYTWGFTAIAVLGLAGLAGTVLRGRRPPAWEPILFGLFLALPLMVSLRFIAEFVVVACPLVIGWWLAIIPSPAKGPRVWQAAEVALGLALLPLWWATIAQSPIYRVGLGEKPDKFPAQAVAFLQKTRPPGPIFNSMGFGGYLMWHLPSYKVFIGGRFLVYTEEFYRLYRKAHTEPAAWKQIEEAFGPTVVVLEYLTDMSGKERMPHLETSPAWSLVFWDPVAKIYLKRVPANAALIDRYEYRWARPSYFGLGHLMGALRDPKYTKTAIREFQRALNDNARNTEAYMGLAFLYSFGPEPNWDEGLEAAGRALELAPRLAKAHALACRAHLGRGEMELARAACSRSLSLNPRDALAHWASRTLRGLPVGKRGGP